MEVEKCLTKAEKKLLRKKERQKSETQIDVTNKKILSFLNVFVYFFVFIASLFNPFDPDLGWELKYGQYFFQNHSVLTTNIFSKIMPNYYWVNHSWGADVILYALFSRFGFFGLIIGGAVLMTAIFYFFSRAAKLSILQEIILFPVFLYLENAFNVGSFRPQLMSLTLLSILIYLISEYENGKVKKIFLAIPLLLVWANIHGEFILGLGIFSLWIILRLIKVKILKTFTKKEVLFLGGTFILSALAILINPFGVGVYTESLVHFFNPNLQFIVEWHPLPIFNQDWWNLIIVGILFLWSIKYLHSKHLLKENLPMVIITSLLLIFSFFSRRYVWPFYYLTFPFLAILIERIGLEEIKHTFAVAIGAISIITLFIFIIKSPFSQYTDMSWDTYCQQRLCSANAAQYLIDHHLNTNPHLLTQYDLGGWLIWNYPQIKPTLDGRMTLWIDDKGYNPLLNYIQYEYNFKDIDTSGYTVVFTSVDKPFIKRFVELVNAGKWKIAYQDHRAVIFVKAK